MRHLRKKGTYPELDFEQESLRAVVSADCLKRIFRNLINKRDYPRHRRLKNHSDRRTADIYQSFDRQ